MYKNNESIFSSVVTGSVLVSTNVITLPSTLSPLLGPHQHVKSIQRLSTLCWFLASLNTPCTRLHSYQNIKEINHRSKETDLEDTRIVPV